MINVGIVGCGYWGAKHVRIFSALSGAKLTMVCDADDEVLRQVRDQYANIRTTPDYGNLLRSQIDAVVIATPVSSHYQLAKEALEHGKHVLVEKPMTADSNQALELIRLADMQNIILMVGHTFIYHPAVSYLRQLIKKGNLGEIYYLDTARLNLGLIRPDINVLWDLAPHDISIALHLLDREPISVSARGATHVYPGVCDVAYIELVFPDDTLAHIHVSWIDPCKVRRVTIVGSKRMAVYNDVSESEKIRIYDKGVTIASENDNFTAWPPKYRFGDVTIPLISNAEPLKLEALDFIQCISEGRRPKCDGWAGFKVVDMLERANASLMNGGERSKIARLDHTVSRPRKQTAEVI